MKELLEMIAQYLLVSSNIQSFLPSEIQGDYSATGINFYNGNMKSQCHFSEFTPVPH
jgi:hypothetical protein